MALLITGAVMYGQSGRKTGREGDQLNVFPNPATGKFSVEVKQQDHPYDVNIYNLMGEMVFHWEATDAGEASLEVDLSKRPDGIYFVELDTDKANVLRRVILERRQ